MTDTAFRPVRRALRVAAPVREPEQEDGLREAAVALVLRNPGELEILLIKRARSVSDPWSGHMALPGGRRDPVDDSLLHTAIRETREETGVELVRDPLGRLTRLGPASRRLPRLAVTPYVFGVSPDTVARVASPEVHSVYWVPLRKLTDPANASIHQHRAGELVRTFPSFEIEGQVVWGLTYRVLEEFLELFPGS